LPRLEGGAGVADLGGGGDFGHPEVINERRLS
jgi:hypothetical protein